MSTPRVERRDTAQPLSAEEAEAVLGLAREARDADGADALSEQFRLSVEGRDTDGVTHLLAYAAEPGPVGYAQCRSGGAGEPPSAELVVAPGARRRGVGSELLAALPEDVRVWSHGPEETAAGFAAARGLQAVRALHVMGRPLTGGEPWGSAVMPPGLTVRAFEVGRDEEEWLRVNAAAFADHPEQGALRRGDLDQRIGQAWFDAAGFILVVPEEEQDRIAAFHWTKVDPPDGAVGEVYVVGVSPQWQGHGLGRAVTVLGLDHLRSRGLRDVVLYVDEDNTAAVRTYRGLGFTDREVHRQWARPTSVHPHVA